VARRLRGTWRHATAPAITVAAVALALLGAPAPGRAQEQIEQQEPTPSSVDQVATPIERSFVPGAAPRPFVLLPSLREDLKDAPPFFRDMKLDVNLRTYYFNREKYDDNHQEALATGGALTFQSGWLLDTLSVGAVLYTSQALHAPDARDGSGLLEPGQQSYTALGQLYARLKLLERNFVNLYRYTYDTPYINRDDSRMSPKTFEGYTLQGSVGGQDGAPALRYGGGYITKLKDKNDDDFVWMSRQAGASVDRGVGLLGALLSYGDLSVGGIDYYCADVINIAYGEVKFLLAVPGGTGVLVSTQYVDQRSVGGNFGTGFAYDTDLFAVKAEGSYRNAIITLAWSRTAEGADVQNPWSGNPGYTGAEIQKFNRAGEQAFMAKLSYDFKRFGVQGLTAYALFVHGWDRINSRTHADVPNENEVNLDVQWRPSWTGFTGLWLRARYGHVEQYQGPKNAMSEYRLVVNYDFSVL
jgi:hypothetical protein